MTEMTAFERRVADGMLHRAGPVRPVDDLAVFDAVIAATRQKGWGFTMFSALKLVAASVVLALFGGFLMMGVLTTQQSDEASPAAVTASPTVEATSAPTEAPTTSVRSDILPGVELTVEEVEPGVFHVLHDGVREMASANIGDIAAGHDGRVWLLRWKGFSPLGHEGWYEWPSWVTRQWGAPQAEFDVTPGGAIWASGAENDKDWLRSFDGESWTLETSLPDSANGITFTVAPDGTVWAAWSGVHGFAVARRGVDGWERLEASSTLRAYLPETLVVGEADGIWYRDHLGRYHYADGAWQEIPAGPSGASDAMWAFEHIADDGTVWEAGLGGPDDDVWPGDGFLRRYDGTEWRTWGPDDGVPPMFSAIGSLQQAPDGGLWLATADVWSEAEHGGIARFDGSTWQQYLPGRVVSNVDIAADGSVWLRALAIDRDGADGPDVRSDLYVITPAAVAANE